MDCDCNTIIDIDNWEIEHKYKIKESRKWKYEKNYTLHIDMDYVDNKLIIYKVQLEGKRGVDYKTFQKAYLSR